MVQKTQNSNEAVIKYVTNVFDGVFSEQELSTRRSYCFYRVANFISPKSGVKLNTILNDEEIGEVLNELSTLQFNRKLQARVARAGEAQF